MIIFCISKSIGKSQNRQELCYTSYKTGRSTVTCRVNAGPPFPQHALLNQKYIDPLPPVVAAQPSPACPAVKPCVLSLWLILLLYQIVPRHHFLPSISLGHNDRACHCLPALCSVSVFLSTPVSTCIYTDRCVYYNKSAYVLYLLSTLLLYRIREDIISFVIATVYF